MKKIDIHTHTALKRTPSGSGNPFDPLDNYIADPSELRAHLKRQGIGRAVLMSSGEGSSPSAAGGNNEVCRTVSKGQPEFFSWMCNFDSESPKTVYDRMAHCKEQGAIGVGELMANEWMNSPFLTAVFSAAEQLEMPVTFHMSPEPGYGYGICDQAGLPLLEETLQRFPGLRLLGHSQVFWLELSADCPRSGAQARSGFGKGPVVPGGRVEQLMRLYPNLYGDLSAYSASCAILRDPAYGLAFLEEFSDRLFYATDTMNSRQVFPLGEFLDKSVAEGKLSRQAWENICFGNARRIYGLSLSE